MTSSATAEAGLKAYWGGVLGQPWIDRTIAIIASVPFVWLAHYRYHQLRLGLPLVSSVTVILVLIVTMIFRRPPKKSHPESGLLVTRIFCDVLAIADLGNTSAGATGGAKYDIGHNCHLCSGCHTMGTLQLGAQHRLRARTARHRDGWSVSLHAPPDLHWSFSWILCSCPSGVHSAKCWSISARGSIVRYQEFC